MYERMPGTGATASVRLKGSVEALPVGEHCPLVPGGFGPGGGLGLKKLTNEEMTSITPALRLALLTPKSKVRSFVTDRVRRPSGLISQPQHSCISSKSSKT